jgi:transcriptional regulator with XRE-family HTH domain
MLPDDPVSRGRLFRAARDLLGWTQARVAGEAGISTAAVTALEVGRRGPWAPAVPLIVDALGRSGVRLAVGGTDDGSCVVHTIHRLVHGSFPSYRGDMEDRDGFLFDLAFALRHKVPPGHFRDLAKRGLRRDELAERIVAEAILEHLLLCGWRLERGLPLAPGGPGLHSRIK